MGTIIDFMPPKNLELGNPAPGTRISLMTQYEVGTDGKLCVAQIEGVNMPGYDPDGSPKTMPETSKFVEKYVENMPDYGGA